MRLIDADKFKEDLMKLWDYSCVDGITATTVLKQVIHDLDNAPTVIWCSKTSEGYPLMDLRPKEKGEWIMQRHDLDGCFYTCSNCGRMIRIPLFIDDPEDNETLADYPYCHCGASMKGGVK